MQIDRRYRGRRRRSPWPIIFLILLVVLPGVYFLATRTRFFENPFNPLQPTATPTRTAVSYLAEAEDAYRAGLLTAAAESYTRVVELEPENDTAFNRLAWLWILRGHPDRAVEPARKAVALKESPGNLAILAMALDWSGEYDEAIKVALRATDADPLSAEAHAVLGEVYADRNNWSRALEEARQAEKLDPEQRVRNSRAGLRALHARTLRRSIGGLCTRRTTRPHPGLYLHQRRCNSHGPAGLRSSH